MANKIVGTKGDDVLKGTKGKDIIKGKGGNDVLIGKGGNDKLIGGKGKDELKGKAGNDVLKGGSGKDLLFGGKGADDHWGGPGRDVFKFNNGDGLFANVKAGSWDDIVFDFQSGTDKFDIPGDGTFPNYRIGHNGVLDVGEGGTGLDGITVRYGEDGVKTGEFFAAGLEPLDPGLSAFFI